jgi:hypothetical protein
MPSLDFDTEGLSPKPPTHTLPLSAFARISIAVRQFRTNDHSPGHLVADRIWFLAFQSAGIGQFADLGRCLEVFCCDSEVGCSGRCDTKGPCVFAAAFEGAVGPFVSVGVVSGVVRVWCVGLLAYSTHRSWSLSDRASTSALMAGRVGFRAWFRRPSSFEMISLTSTTVDSSFELPSTSRRSLMLASATIVMCCWADFDRAAICSNAHFQTASLMCHETP